MLLVLVLIPGIGNVANGTRGWFVVAGFSMQPSELTKIAFAIWGAHLLATRRMERASLREMLVPLVPAAVIALALIVAQPDLGQTVSLGIILLALLWYAGLPLKVFVSSLLAAMVAAAVLAVSEGYRSDRVRSWLDPGADAQGVGLPGPAGQVRAGQRWRLRRRPRARAPRSGTTCPTPTTTSSSPSSARNSASSAPFGLLCLFGLFAYTGMRIARRSADPFLRLLTATATMWVIGQVFINVGYVIGLLPVTGHPAAADLGRRNINGDNAFHDRTDGQRGPPRARGGGRPAGRPRRPDEPAAAAAAARALRAHPGGGAARPAARPSRRERQAGQARQAAAKPAEAGHAASRPQR